MFIHISSTACLCIWLNGTTFCSHSSSSRVYAGFRKTVAILPAISFYRLVAAVDPDWHSWGRKPSEINPAHSFGCLGDLHHMEDWISIPPLPAKAAILTLESVQIFSRHSRLETAKVQPFWFGNIFIHATTIVSRHCISITTYSNSTLPNTRRVKSKQQAKRGMWFIYFLSFHRELACEVQETGFPIF